MVQVTGGSAGIGKAAALAFGANGARVAVMGRRKERLDSVVDQLPGGLAVVGDLTIPEDCQRAIEETVAAFGGLDILVNNGAPSEPIVLTLILYLLAIMNTLRSTITDCCCLRWLPCRERVTI